MKNTTILQVIPTLNAGGAERTTLDVAKAIMQAGGRAIVVSQGGRLVEELEASGAVHIEMPVASKNPIVMVRNIWRLRKLIADYNVSIIHARSRAPAWSARLAVLLFQALKCYASTLDFTPLRALRSRSCQRISCVEEVHFITTYHGIYNSGNAVKRFYNSIMARGEVVIANSAFTAAHVLNEHPFASGNITIIPRGTDFEQLTPEHIDVSRMQAMREIWGVNENQRIILLPARLTRWKGQLVLIEAIAALKAQGQLPEDVHIVLAGDAQGRHEYVAELNASIAKHGLQNCITIAPHIIDMPAAYKATYAVIVPSTDPEAFGRVPVEAQAMGLPVIVSDHGAPRETVIEGETGWRVAPSNPQALAEALNIVLNLSDEHRADLAQRARTHVLEQFSLAQMLAATLQVYDSVLKK